MRISSIESIPISLPLPEPVFDATATWSEFNSLIVKVMTSDGVMGVADIAPLHGREMPIFKSVIEKKLKKQVIGEEPFNLEKLWVSMVGKGSSAYALGTKGAIITAASAIDVALWDIVAKSLGTPLYNLLGGRFRNEVKLYLSFMGKRPDNRIKSLLDRGFEAVKIKSGFDPKEDIDRIAGIRERLGYNFDLMVDINQGYDLRQAIEFATDAERYEIYWIEEPIDVHNVRALKVLSERTKIPIGLGENYYGKDEFFSVLDKMVVGVLQPDINHAGGLTPMRKIISIADVFGVPVAPHLHSIIGFAVGLHLLTSIPNGLIAEYVIYGERWEERDRILRDLVSIEDGNARLRCKSGIGIELDESYLEQFRCKE